MCDKAVKENVPDIAVGRKGPETYTVYVRKDGTESRERIKYCKLGIDENSIDFVSRYNTEAFKRLAASK